MGNALDHTSEPGGKSGQVPEARAALSKEFAGDLGRLPVYPGPASANELLQSGADRLHVPQQDTIGSAMSAFKDANHWDPAVVVHLTKGGMTHLNGLSNAGILDHRQTSDLNSVAPGSLVFGTGPDGNVQAAVKGQNSLYYIGEGNKWVSGNGQDRFQPGTKFDTYTQVKPMETLSDDQRQELAALSGRPISFGAIDLKPGAKPMPAQLEDGVKTGAFTKQEGLDWATVNQTGKEGDIFVSKDGAVRGRLTDDNVLQMWNHDRKMYVKPQEADVAKYNSMQFTLYHPTPKV